MIAKLWVTCFRDMALDSNNRLIGAPMVPPVGEQVIDITHESLMGEPFPKYTKFISIKAESDCCVAFGDEPIADNNFHLIESGERLFYGVMEGQRIAVIDALRI